MDRLEAEALTANESLTLLSCVYDPFDIEDSFTSGQWSACSSSTLAMCSQTIIQVTSSTPRVNLPTDVGLPVGRGTRHRVVLWNWRGITTPDDSLRVTVTLSSSWRRYHAGLLTLYPPVAADAPYFSCSPTEVAVLALQSAPLLNVILITEIDSVQRTASFLPSSTTSIVTWPPNAFQWNGTSPTTTDVTVWYTPKSLDIGLSSGLLTQCRTAP